jgi:glutathione synthase
MLGNKKMKIAFQMDEFNKLNFKTDSSIYLMETYFANNWEVFFYAPQNLSLLENKLVAKLYKLNKTNPLEYSLANNEDINNMNIVMLRQDPPFDMAYITSTFLLEKLPNTTKVINNPVSVRNSPEKLLVTNFSQLMPKTLISSNFETIYEFLEQKQKCVIKPLYGNAGSNVFYLDINDFNAKALIEYFLHTFKEQVMIQEFLPNVKNGDKRIILFNGQPVGFFDRVPPKNQIKANIASGGTAVVSPLTPKENVICETIKPTLQKLGLFFVGIDVIDGYLTEINVTSPTGLKLWHSLTGENLGQLMFEEINKLYF